MSKFTIGLRDACGERSPYSPPHCHQDFCLAFLPGSWAVFRRERAMVCRGGAPVTHTAGVSRRSCQRAKFPTEIRPRRPPMVRAKSTWESRIGCSSPAWGKRQPQPAALYDGFDQELCEYSNPWVALDALDALIDSAFTVGPSADELVSFPKIATCPPTRWVYPGVAAGLIKITSQLTCFSENSHQDVEIGLPLTIEGHRQVQTLKATAVGDLNRLRSLRGDSA